MKFITVPGYRELFGEPKETYEELVKDIPSYLVVTVAICLNNELGSNELEREKQKRLLVAFVTDQSPETARSLATSLQNYAKTINPGYDGLIFIRQYLMAWICKELNSYREFDIEAMSPAHELNLFKAYMLIIDEEKKRNVNFSKIILESFKAKGDKYMLLWPESAVQLDFNEFANISFEMFKLLCLTTYFKAHHTKYLKEYLDRLGFKSVGELMGSFYQLQNPFTPDNKDIIFKRLRYIKPVGDDKHLRDLAINKDIGNKTISYFDLKKRTLFHNRVRGYMVIDPEWHNRKFYRGPYFDLFYNTSMVDDYRLKEWDFSNYTAEMSKAVLEQVCFRTIIKQLTGSKHDILLFDTTGEDGFPDAYYRHKKIVFLIECKGYLFPESITKSPDFEEIKKHIRSRFIHNGKKGKGIAQIVEQIGRLRNGEFKADVQFNDELRNKKVIVYPVICHDEINYHMLGLNEYLAGELTSRTSDAPGTGYTIKPLTLVNLKTLYELASRKEMLMEFSELIDRYHEITKTKLRRSFRFHSLEDYMSGHSSFDEVYRSMFFERVKKERPIKKENASMWTNAIGLTQQKLNEVVT